MNLSQLMKLVSEHWQFTSEKYPALENGDERALFITRHIVLHMNKGVGAIAAEAENADHGGSMNHHALVTTTAKMLVNVLKLADELGMTAEQLVGGTMLVLANGTITKGDH